MARSVKRSWSIGQSAPLMDSDFDEADTEVLAVIIGRLGLADVAEFGLRWQDCEEFLRRLGYRATVTVSTA